MSLFSGTKLTADRVEQIAHQRIKEIVKRLTDGEIEPPDAIRLLSELMRKAVNALSELKEQQNAKL